MNLFNSLTQRGEPLKPEGDTVTLYVCGITPYDTTHLGHAFTYTMADVLVRYLEYQGYTVRYVQNVTDVDDDILRKAREVAEDWRALGNRWTAHYIRDMQALNVRPPDVYPRASDVIGPIIDMVQRLLATGVAYEAGGNVYYHVDDWPAFGQLSHLDRDAMLPIANARGNHPDDPLKRDPLDFVLWQTQAPGEPAWDSPWGPGRPGWHIECSAMSTVFLGSTIDIHAGGADLLFPHHECEIAQVEPVTGEAPFVRIWMHMAMVQHDGEKMSKSLGNLVMVHDLLETTTPDALRLYLAEQHYRSAWGYDEAALRDASARVEAWQAAVTADGGSGAALDADAPRGAFLAAMNDDLDTAAALKVLDGLAGQIVAAAQRGEQVISAQMALRRMSQVFGVRLDATMTDVRVLSGWDEHLRRFE